MSHRTHPVAALRVVVASGPAVLACWLSGAGPRAALACVCVVALAVLLPGRVLLGRWWLRSGIAALAGVAVATGTSARVGAAVALGLVLSDWMLLERPPLPGLPGGSRVRTAWSRSAGLVVSRVVFAVLWVPAVLVPWMVGRVAGVDPVGSLAGWGSVPSAPVHPRRPWARGRPLHTAGERWRRVGVVAVAVALLVAVTAPLWRPVDPDALDETPAAFADAAWYPEYVRDMNWVMHGSGYEPLAAVRVKEARTLHVNVVDGRRVTWSPPACDGCRRLRVWVYGGSTTFGLGQRDGHTIPSELARVAFDDGVVLDVQNRGVGGDTHWEAAQRFAWDVTVGAPPDVVVFYDGTNEFMASRFDERADAAPSVIPAEFYEEYRERVPAEDRTPPAGAAWPEPPAEPASTAAEAGRVVAERYERSRWLSRVTAESAGVVPVWIWQPTADQRPVLEGEPAGPGREWARARTAGARSALRSDVVDLSRVLEDVPTPLYYDGIHTNELGARVVAEQVYARLRPELRRLAAAATEAPTGGGG